MFAGIAAADVAYTALSTGGTFTVVRRATLKRGEAPYNQTIYYHNGTAWISVAVGPGQADLNINMNSPSGYALSTSKTWSNTGPSGSYIECETPEGTRNIEFAMSAAARDSGPIVLAPVKIGPVKATITKGGGSQGTTYTHIEPVNAIIHLTGIEGASGVWVDNGFGPDFDGDNIPDATDPDDDNDGRPDASDDFPQNANEKDDSDNDGTGDNADTDDDNDGRPDTEDDFPNDPDQNFNDRDGDGVGDSMDAFPDNGREAVDPDGDGVGNNSDNDDDNDGIGDDSDPDDHTPPSSPDPPPNQGDGQGNAGSGDGSGGPGPTPGSGDTPAESGDAGGFTLGGTLKPGSEHDVAGATSGLGQTIGSKIGNFRPMSVGILPKTASQSLGFTHPKFGTFNYTLHFDAAPWTVLRTLLLILVAFVIGRDLLHRLSI